MAKAKRSAKASPASRKKIKYPYDYDPAKRKLAKVYMRVKLIAGVVNGLLIPVLFLAAFFFLGPAFQLRDLVGGMGFLAVPLFVIVLATLLNLVQFPLRYWSSLIYERKYGLSRYTFKGWFVDYLKGLFIGYLFAVILFSILWSFIGISYWWVYAAVLYFFVDVFMSSIYPVFILPLFYKLKPFQNKRLKAKLMAMVKSSGGGNIETIEVAKESEKSVKANAMFAGWGKTKKMILFDTLLDNFTEDEIETVIGHELGHYVQKDVWRDIILSTVLIFPILYAVHVLMTWTAAGTPLAGIADLAAIPLFMLLMELLDLVVMPLENWHSRWREKEADWFGLQHSKKPKAQISTEKRLADQALSDVSPHPFLEWYLFTHPNAEKRIAMVKDWERKQGNKRSKPRK